MKDYNEPEFIIHSLNLEGEIRSERSSVWQGERLKQLFVRAGSFLLPEHAENKHCSRVLVLRLLIK